MSKVRANLKQQMQEVNQNSYDAAVSMQQAHERLRAEMQQVLLRAREAEENKRTAERHAAGIKNFRQRTAGVKGSAFLRIMSKIGLMNTVDDDLREKEEQQHDIANKQEAIANRQMEIVRRKAQDWNEMRKSVHEDGTFRQYYNSFDEAAARFHMVNRDGTDQAVEKDVKEYVGEFDMEKLDETFTNLSQNTDAEPDIAFKNKKDGRGNNAEDLIKAHRRITLLSEADERGNVTRFKLNSNFEGYMAARQFEDGSTTLLQARSQDFAKVNMAVQQMRLQVDEKDASGEQFINSEHNIEIRQATQRKWFGAKTLNGIFLNGQFVSTDYNVIKGMEDSSLGILTTWNSAKEREKVRKAVLKASIFRQMNSKTIQHAMGYGASGDAKAGDIIEAIEKETAKPEFLEKDHDEWEETIIGDNVEEKEKISSPIKTKIAYDVLRDLMDEDENVDVAEKLEKDPEYRGSVLLNSLRSDRKALKDTARLFLSKDNEPKYWNIAKVICGHYLGGRFKYTLKNARSDHGQLMRVALIDELNSNRDFLDGTNPIGAFTPTKWKQFNDEVNAQRGFGAGLLQKVLDGSIQDFVSDLIDSTVGVAQALDDKNIGLGRGADITNAYAAVLAGAADMGMVVEGGAYLYSDNVMDDKMVKGDDGKMVHTSDQRRNTISFYVGMIRSLAKIASQTYKFYKNMKKEYDAKFEQDKKPDLKAREYMQATESAVFKIVESSLVVVSEIGKSLAGRFGEKQLKSFFGGVRSLIKTVTNTIGAIKENHAVNMIIDREKEFKSAMSRVENNEPKQQGDEELVQILKNNSQLQYGMACSKRHHRNERLSKIFGAISNGGKTIINGIKAFFPVLSKTKVFKLAEAVWGAAVSGVEMVTAMVRSKLTVKANIEKMLGKEFRGVNSGTLNSVLRREAGIVSSDYLTDLARIFMSIDTHVFMKEAETDMEKEVGAKIARTLLDNHNFTKDNINKVDVNKLMGTMGVKGNFRKILKYSLS